VRTRTGRGVSLPKARGNFFTRKNYPQSIDTDNLILRIDFSYFLCYNKPKIGEIHGMDGNQKLGARSRKPEDRILDSVEGVKFRNINIVMSEV
jgi:hypothetical protein